MLFYFYFYLDCLAAFFFFFFNDTATTEIYTLSLHDALPIFRGGSGGGCRRDRWPGFRGRSEEHTSELQSRENLVCRLLLEKKKKNEKNPINKKNKKKNQKKKKKKKKT